MLTINSDPFLIVGIALQIIIILIVNIYTFINYASPDDNNESWFPKFVVVFSLQTAMMCVLLLPIDVANNGGNPNCDGSNSNGVFCGRINILLMWEVLFMCIVLLLIFFIPFAAFFYLADDGIALGIGRQSKVRPAILNTLVVLAIAAALLLGLYFTSNKASLDVKSYEVNFDDVPLTEYQKTTGWATPYSIISLQLTPAEIAHALTTSVPYYIEYSVTFPIYTIALVGWIGWWLFSLFAGVGLAALPFDLVYDFLRRVKRVPPDAVAEKEKEIQIRTAELIEASVALKRARIEFEKTGPSSYQRRRQLIQDRVQVNRITQFVFLLERDTQDLRDIKAYNANADNPFTPYFKLLGGIFLAGVSALWILQIVLFMLPSPPINSLLNTYFVLFDSWFPIFGDLSFALFSLYLMMCTIKGAFRIGLSLFCIKVYPMVVNGTYTDAFLFNVAIILLCTIPLVQFCLIAFSEYAKYSDIYQV